MRRPKPASKAGTARPRTAGKPPRQHPAARGAPSRAPRRPPGKRRPQAGTGRRNPAGAGTRPGVPRRSLNPAERRQLAEATRLSAAFHGTPRVIELSPAERRLPRFVAEIGDQVEQVYQPPDASRRGKTIWHHKSGERGPLHPPGTGARRRPKVVAAGGRVYTIPAGSPQRFSPSRGIVD